MGNSYGESITIEVVQGGFILTYPVVDATTGDTTGGAREVFTSPRKLQQKLKEVIATLSTVAPDADA